MNQPNSPNQEFKDWSSTERDQVNQIKNIGALQKVLDSIEALAKMAIDPKASSGAKALAIACLLYLISPFDVIPDVLPVVGWSDDIALIVATVSQLAMELAPYMALGVVLSPDNNAPKVQNNVIVVDVIPKNEQPNKGLPKNEQPTNLTSIEQLKRFQIIMTAALILVAIVAMSSLVLNVLWMANLTHH